MGKMAALVWTFFCYFSLFLTDFAHPRKPQLEQFVKEVETVFPVNNIYVNYQKSEKQLSEMPLPQFLRYRLAKRGIIHGEDADKVPDVVPPPVEEEVIAEDYDTPRKGNSNEANDNEAGDNSSDNELKLLGHPGCPNKYNIYHECTVFCKEKWGVGHGEPDTKYQRLKQKMLQKYPLPITWMEVYDPGSGRHYYWEYESDYVSWLPPLHPRAIIAEPASMLRQAVLPSKDSTTTDGEKGSDAEEVEEVNVERPERHKEEKERKRDTEKRSRDDDRRDWHEDERRREGMERSKSKLRKRDSDDEEGKPSRSKEDRERKRDGGDRKGDDRHREDKERPRGKGWKGNADGALDPMDPAAYSDTPRGTWSTGLERKNEAKTGADTTAAGPLYQMRPYPSPGDVLRANSKTSEPREGYKPTKSRRAP